MDIEDIADAIQDSLDAARRRRRAAASALIRRFPGMPSSDATYRVAGGPIDAIGRVVAAAFGRTLAGAPRDVPEPAEGDLIEALGLVQAARADMDEYEARLISAARTKGVIWKDIAAALGLDSSQAAQQRHQRLRETMAKPLADTVVRNRMRRAQQTGSQRS